MMMMSWLAELDELDPEQNLSWVTSEQLGAGLWSCVSRGGASSWVCSGPAGPAGGALQDHSAGRTSSGAVGGATTACSSPQDEKVLSHVGMATAQTPWWLFQLPPWFLLDLGQSDQEVEPSARLTCAARLEH